jgi:hypothetical protein
VEAQWHCDLAPSTSPGTPNDVYVRLSSGTAFAAGTGTSWGAATGLNTVAIDVTGDGKADLVDPTTTTVRIAGTGTFSAATAWAATGFPSTSLITDVDGPRTVGGGVLAGGFEGEGDVDVAVESVGDLLE